ncbi:MAG: GNAT family N-acetyltransferase [Flavobacteriaceae bacterium]|jgi:RimJ/RimL family protein N-acetyltransferase|nr:GNAT family N-acetyltransferase [Flavobacteriaceae bacterium]
MPYVIPAFDTIPWKNLFHTQGRATDVVALFHAIDHSDEQISRMALYELANRAEQEGKLSPISPLVLLYFQELLHKNSTHRDFILRCIKRIATSVAYQWEEYRTNNSFSYSEDLAILWQTDSPMYWPDFISEQEDQLLWSTQNKNQIDEIIWHYTAKILIDSQELLERIAEPTPLAYGLLYDILTVLKMIKPQERIALPRSFVWQTELFRLRAIHPTDRTNLGTYLQGDVAQYLSFDPNGNMRIIDFYIDQSIIEQQAGTALVLIIEHSLTGEFLGSCALNDINSESVELGLWLKPTAQGKGLGLQVVQAMIALIQQHLQTSYILYNVEQANKASIRIPEALHFTKGPSFLIEPTPLKNAIREMEEYRFYL